ncbi:MAG: PAC2 family protein [Candidatus Omnitrophica bacterium]|nr:PAC2 family protein [Candidatus Omnitrophota bacterium]
MEGIKITKRPRLRKPYLIIAWPGMGEVAFKAVTFLVENLKAEEFAEIIPEEFFYLTGSVIKDGVLSVPQMPQNKFYFWKNKNGKNDLIIFLSNAQPDLMKAEEYSRRIIEFARLYKVDTVVGFASMPQPIEHAHEPGVWYTSTSAELNTFLKKYNFRNLSEGQISGMNGLFLGIAKREGLNGFCLLGEIPLYTIQIENPRASLAVLGAFAKIFGIQLDLSSLKEQAYVMENEINKLLDYLKLGPQGMGPIGEEEIERIKKTLGQLTKLPLSVKEKIEKLFSAAKGDLAKASELKVELDRWNVYKEYEDKFLDLFRKAKGKSN